MLSLRNKSQSFSPFYPSSPPPAPHLPCSPHTFDTKTLPKRTAAWAAEAAVSSSPPSLQPHDASERTPLQQETDPGGGQGAPAGHSKIVSASSETAGEGEPLRPSSLNSFNKEIVEDHTKVKRKKNREREDEL